MTLPRCASKIAFSIGRDRLGLGRGRRNGVKSTLSPSPRCPPGHPRLCTEGPMPGPTLSLAACVLLAAASPKLPETPKKPVVDTYQGVQVTDEYRWLEDDHDPSVKTWSDEQNAVTRAYLDAIPERKDILARVTALTAARTPRYFELKVRGTTTF